MGAIFYVLVTILALAPLAPCQPQRPLPDNHEHHELSPSGNPCYDETMAPQRCVPDFINAAFGRPVDVTNTCGVRTKTEYCVQTQHTGMSKTCEHCDNWDDARRHPASYLTDFNVPPNETWWQSETMFEGIQHPTSVNLTLHLGKAFDITYVRLKFHSPRPESLAIYKKSDSDSEWIPWAYYSASCRATYQKVPGTPIMLENEDKAVCSKEYSDISPLSGGNVVFSTLEGRPSADRFEFSTVLQNWVTATDIRVVLNRLNTFGDEIFKDEKVLRSYYYAISDFAVGGRCKCNGHASRCVKSTGQGEESRLVCTCEHDTYGDDCNQCRPFYNARPWQAATAVDANQCQRCDCNGLASHCEFDPDLFAESGEKDGGRCVGCTGNTRGPHCEQCTDNHYRREGERHCVPCDCDPTGSENLQCNDEGQCPCKPGVTGRRCDQCQSGFYEFTTQGCRDCKCHEAGSLNNEKWCDPETGDCKCKTLVEGKQCNACPPGTFNLDYDNEFGCTKCFCYGHFKSCDMAEGFFKMNITSTFDNGDVGWRAEVADGAQTMQVQPSEPDQSIAIADSQGRPVYFVASEKFLGDQRASYNKYLGFELRITTDQPRDSMKDVIIEGTSGTIWTQIFAQDNPMPTKVKQTYRFRLHEDPRFRWQPQLSPLDFLGVLSNVTAIKIRGTYQSADVGYLSSVWLTSASREPPSRDPQPSDEVGWVELCSCLQGHVGQFCEGCAAGYKRRTPYGGPFSRCIPCECHGHSDTCEPESGKCMCEHNTAGSTCEKCARGFYGDAMKGTEDACTPCPCPNGTACVLMPDGEPYCTECPDGYTGRFCDLCNDGHYGNPKEGKPCQPCDCSGNIDPNAIGNCDQRTGECRKCVYDTSGFHCERCKAGYWGDALLDTKGDCSPCECFSAGTSKPSADYDVLECEQNDGQCECMPNVQGRRCDRCMDGYFNLTSGAGCSACACDPIGSSNSTCEQRHGQCRCKPGVTGRQCDQCAPGHYGFGPNGCKECQCDTTGSVSSRCDVETGQCECKHNVRGRACDQCAENMFDLQAGCRMCGECYTLVQQRVNSHREKLDTLEELLKEIMENPVTVNDDDFDNRLEQVKKDVGFLVDETQDALAGGDAAVVSQVEDLEATLAAAADRLTQLDAVLANTTAAAHSTKAQLDRWHQIQESIYESVETARKLLATEGTESWDAAKAAAKRYGAQSQQLTELAGDARRLADKHEEQAEMTEAAAEKALKTAEQALSSAEEAIFGGKKTSEEIGKLSKRVKDAAEALNATQKLAATQHEAASNANKAAVTAFSEVVGLELPDVAPEKTIIRAKELAAEAELAEENALREAADNRDVVADAASARLDSQFALQRAQGMQQQADEILADLDASRARAREAIELANKTLIDADQTLNTLIEFDSLVAESRAQAADRLTAVDDIRSVIAEAENRTNQAEDALGGAKEDAAGAESIAAAAQKFAEDASKAAADVRERAAASKTSAQGMKEEADELLDKVQAELDTAGNYKNQATKDAASAADAVAAATQAEVAADDANETVATAIEQVKAVLDRLENLDSLSTTELDELEAQLTSAQSALDSAQLDNRVAELKAAQATQQRTINQYERDMSLLRKEVENVEQIRDALPERCFNVVKLEHGT